MGLNNPKGGIGYAAEFQSSALPFVTSTIAPVAVSGSLRVDFSKISRFVTIANHAAAGKYLRIGFTDNGVRGNNFFLLDGGHDSQIMELRVTSLYLAGASGSVEFSLMAGLTNIDAIEMPPLTGTLPGNTPGWDGVG